MKEENTIDMDQAIELLQISRPTFYRWLKSGKVRGAKLGRIWRFNKNDIERINRGEKPEITIEGDLTPLTEQLEQFIDKNSAKKINFAQLNCNQVEKVCLLMILSANSVQATDIHLSSTVDEHNYNSIGVIRLRIQGGLETIAIFDHIQVQGIIEKWMSLTHCNLHKKTIPQDGRIQYNLHEFSDSLPYKKIDCLINFTPSFHGISLTAQLLYMDAVLERMNMEIFGFAPENIKKIDQAINQPYGIVLVSSPHGNGKTTLLLSLLKKIAGPHKKIATIENPIQAIIPWVTQTQVNEFEGLSYENSINTIMKADPDVVMISELDKDDQILKMGVDIANTGHLLLGSFQCRNVVESLEKILILSPHKKGVIAELLQIIISQRLLRKLCPYCKQKCKPTKDQLKQMINLENIPEKLLHTSIFYKAKGCSKCFNGYKGRIAMKKP